MRKIVALTLVTFMVPILVRAQNVTWIVNIADESIDLFDLLVPMLLGVGLVVFLYGLAKYIFFAGDDKMRADGRMFMLWGVVALFCIVAVWGIVEVVLVIAGVPAAPGTIQMPGVTI